MARTLKEIRDQLLDETRRTGQLTSQATTYINSAIDFYKHDTFRFNEETVTATTTAGSEYIDLPADFDIEFSISIDSNGNGDFFPLKRLTMQEMDERYMNSSDYTGQPEYYTIFGEQLRLLPVPDASDYQILYAYRKMPTSDLSADADTNFFLDNAYDLVLNRAGAIMSIKILEDEKKAMQFKLIEKEEVAKHRSRTTQYALRGSTKRRR